MEIKRQLGKVNNSEPDETDVFAFLNRALEGIWNYGARLNSPALMKREAFVSQSGTVLIPGGAMKVQSVRERDSGMFVPNVSLASAEAVGAESGQRCYVAYPDRVDIYPLALPVSVDIVYLPAFCRLKERSAELPFPSELDNSVISMVVEMMGGGNSDELMSRVRYGNALSRYFRPRGADCVVCRGPW
ncbi:MAG: hypothetical protein Q4D58_09750 [Synergistaceae bacterium]|nr:hypothetical protein [Synergistaceae bacterium]